MGWALPHFNLDYKPEIEKIILDINKWLNIVIIHCFLFNGIALNKDIVPLCSLNAFCTRCLIFFFFFLNKDCGLRYRVFKG